MSQVFAGPVPCGGCGLPLPTAELGRARCLCGREARVFRFRPRARSRAPSQTPLADGAACAYHAGNAADATCTRCGSFLCALCATPIQGATYCTACFERLHAQGELSALKNRYPRPHAVALLLSLAALVPLVSFLAAPPALWQAMVALRRRQELSLREGGVVTRALTGLLLSLAGLGLSAWAVWAALHE